MAKKPITKSQIRSVISLIVALAALLLGGGEVYQRLPKADVAIPVDESYAFVQKVIDGDTFELINGQKVRMIGIDTPESVDPRRPVEYYGQEASRYAKELLEKRYVVLKKDVSETDRYGRLLRYVYLGDGTFINEKLVREGYARSISFPPDIRYQELFRHAEEDARTNKRGLWQ